MSLRKALLTTFASLWMLEANAYTALSFNGAPTVVGAGEVGTTALWGNVGTVAGVDVDLVLYVADNLNASLSFETAGDNLRVYLDAGLSQDVELEARFYVAGTFGTVNEELVTLSARIVLFPGLGCNVLSLSKQITLEEAGLAGYRVESATNLTLLDLGADLQITTLLDLGILDTFAAIRADFHPAQILPMVFSRLGPGTCYFEVDGNLDLGFSSPSITLLDSTPPVPPTVAALTTNDATPVLSGTAEAFTTIDVAVGGAGYETYASAGGTWSVDTGSATPISGAFSPVVNGSNEVTVTSTDAAGNSATDGTTNELTIDTTAPATPTVSALVTNDTTPTLSGTAEAGSAVQIVVAGATYDTTATGGGAWSLDTGVVAPTAGAFSPNVNGANDVAVTSTDAAGNAASDATADELTLDTTAPVAPTVAAQLTNDTTPVLSGTAEAGSAVQVVVAGATYDTTASGGGAWSLDTGVAAPSSGAFAPNVNGTNEVAVTSTDAAGNSASDATSNELTIDTTDPVTPTVATQTTNDTTPVLTGTAEAGSTVQVVVAGATYDTAASGGGAWSVDTGVAAPSSGAFAPNVNGTNEVAVTSTDAAGNSASDATSNELTIDTTDPVTPTVAAQTTNDTTPVLTGTAEAGSTLQIVVAGATYDTAASGGGTWSLDTGVAAPSSGAFAPNVNGTNEVAVTSTDAAGNNASDATSNELTIDTTAAAVVLDPPPVANAANQAGYPVGGTCTVGDGDVTVGIPGATPSSQLAVCAGGTWFATFDVSAIGDGTVALAVQASQTDAGGNTGSDSATASKDTLAPTLAVAQNGSGGDDTYNGLEDDAVVVAGTTTAEAGQVVAVLFSDGTATVAQTAVVEPGGAWSADPVDLSGLAEGGLTLTVDVDDAAGNPAPQVAQALTHATAGPGLTAQSIGSTNDTTPLLQGSTDVVAGRTVSVVDATDAELCVATIEGGAPANTWRCTPSTALGHGTHNLRATVTDAGGNSAEVDFTVTIELDADGDGLPDALEGAMDTDGDGLADFLDPDSDNDGILDVDEHGGLPTLSGLDTDADGIDDAFDVDVTGGSDVNSNGIDDTFEGADADGDGVPNHRDPDADNDGIPDRLEGNGDTDGDGTPDYLDTDSDGDGVPDGIEERNLPPLSGTDSDADGIDDAIDVDVTGGLDANGNGVDDSLEPQDSDGDGRADHLDPDADNDGLPDAIEAETMPAATGSDADADGIDDAYDIDVTGGTDGNGDGLDDRTAPRDSDLDGTPDIADADADGDGIPDSIEADVSGTDTDADGIDDAYDVDVTGGPDADGDGVDDRGATDTDADGVPDFRDLDTDNDGRSDVDEAPLPDDDLDGRADGGATTSSPANTDGTDEPDYRDLDSDNDGTLDIAGSDAAAFDGDGDGRVDASLPDTDGDGVPDVIDGEPQIPGLGGDHDGDGIGNSLDADDDGDGIPDSLERDNGVDRDSDGDGTVDRLDRDSDGDGIPDSVEASGSGAADLDADGELDDTADADGDGMADSSPNTSVRDTDGDGRPDYIDLDSDGDGHSDLAEASDRAVMLDADADGRIDGTRDLDGDGLADVVDPVIGDGLGTPGEPLSISDFDGDGIPDHLDTDSDNDGIDDALENGDFDNDGVPDNRQNDGALQTATSGTGSLGLVGLLGLGALAWLGRRRRRTATVLAGSLAALLTFGYLVPEAARAQAACPGVEMPDQAVSKQPLPAGNRGCWYVTGGIGFTEVDPEGSSNGWRTVDDSSSGHKIGAGYRIRPRWSVELSVADAGEAGIGNVNPLVTETAAISYSIPAVFAVYWLRPATRDLNFFAKAGLSFIGNDSNDARVRFEQQSSAQFAFGMGLHWQLDRRWFLRVEHDGYDNDMTYTGVAVGWRFGARR